jgi:CIC family chloride channel protein
MKHSPLQLASVARYELGALVRWLLLCVAVGMAAGLAAALFVSATDGLQFQVLDRLLGVVLDRPPGEPAPAVDGPALLPRWLLPLVPALGGLVCGLVALVLGSKVYGGGTDHVLSAYHREQGRMGWRAPLGKWLASVATLGTGGSGGREGPMSLVGAGVGSLVARLFRVGDRERRLLLLAGAGAAIGAVFRIPLGAAIFSIEVLYRDGTEEEGIFPCLIASVSAYSVFLGMHGSGHLFATGSFGELSLTSVPLFALVGLAVVPFGFLFTESIRAVKARTAQVPLPRWLMPALGGLVVGLMGLFIHPELLGVGYGWVQTQLRAVPSADGTLQAAGIVLLLAMGKIIATALTVGTGGSAGTFAPVVVVGGLVGGAVGEALHVLWPALAPVPARYALVGMGALMAGVAHVPLAAVIIVCELAGNYELLVPLMGAVSISYLLLRRTSLYPSQVRNPAASPVWAGAVALDALETLRVADLTPLRPAAEPVPADLPLAALMRKLTERHDTVFPVRDENGRVTGMVTLEVLRGLLDSAGLWRSLIAADAAVPIVSVRSSDSFRTLFERLQSSEGAELLVMDDDGRVLGVVGHADLARLTLLEASRRAREARVGSHRPLA